MAPRKGSIPSHVKKKIFSHVGIDHPAVQILESVEDPRKPSQFFRHSLTSVLFMVIVAQICGAKDWPQVVVMCEGMRDWLAGYVDISSGIPCERTFKNIFSIIKPELMEELLRQTADHLREKLPQEVVSFDGQTERGTCDRSNNNRGIHLLSAWSSENEICLGHVTVDEKSNEITAMPRLIETLDLKGTIITADALNTQKNTVAKAVSGGADYLLPVKGNQPTLLEEILSGFKQLDEEQAKAKEQWERAVEKAKEHRDEKRLKSLLEDGPRSCGATTWESTEKGHGRIETRHCTTLSAKNIPSHSEWEGFKTIVRICRERMQKGKSQKETVYYITSLGQEAETIANAARSHWRVENSLHWRLDVIFNQDRSRYRDRIGAQNFATCRKVVLNLLRRESSLKRGIATKQAAAACNPAYREKIVKNLF